MKNATRHEYNDEAKKLNCNSKYANIENNEMINKIIKKRYNFFYRYRNVYIIK